MASTQREQFINADFHLLCEGAEVQACQFGFKYIEAGGDRSMGCEQVAGPGGT